MKILLFLSVFFSTAYASDFTKQIWSHGDDHYIFTYQASTNLLVSENCLNDEVHLEKSKCEALLALKKKNSLVADKKAGTGGKNPGAVVCKDLLKKKIIMLKDQKNNENSFCSFGDGSMISAISLASLLKD